MNTKPLLPLALILATPALAAAPDPAMQIAGTRLTVSATGSVTRTPDLATITTGVVTQARTAAAAMSDNAARMGATIAALKHAGVADRDIQTNALTLNAQYRYADGQPAVLTGYQANNRVAVRLHDLGRVGGTLDALVAAGANQIDGPEFALDHPEAALDEARTKALGLARARADLYARAAGLHVGRIISIDEAESSPPIVRPMMMMAARAKAETPIESGEQALAVTLSVVFELD